MGAYLFSDLPEEGKQEIYDNNIEHFLEIYVGNNAANDFLISKGLESRDWIKQGSFAIRQPFMQIVEKELTNLIQLETDPDKKQKLQKYHLLKKQMALDLMYVENTQLFSRFKNRLSIKKEADSVTGEKQKLKQWKLFLSQEIEWDLANTASQKERLLRFLEKTGKNNLAKAWEVAFRFGPKEDEKQIAELLAKLEEQLMKEMEWFEGFVNELFEQAAELIEKQEKTHRESIYERLLEEKDTYFTAGGDRVKSPFA